MPEMTGANAREYPSIGKTATCIPSCYRRCKR